MLLREVRKERFRVVPIWELGKIAQLVVKHAAGTQRARYEVAVDQQKRAYWEVPTLYRRVAEHKPDGVVGRRPGS